MLKRSLFTNITPLPATISRETAVEQLHDHSTMIELNPIVIRHIRTTPPPNAEPDEAENMLWYEITDEIQYLPGTPLKGEVSYKAGFYDQPHGLQTHVFAPAGVDIRGKWSVGGNIPGEKREPMELGVDKPRDGLYLREDVDLRCNVFMMSFVKRNLNKSHKVMVEDLLKKADLLEEKKSQTSRLGSSYSYRADTPNRAENNMFSPVSPTHTWPASHPSRNPTPNYSNNNFDEDSAFRSTSYPASPQREPIDPISHTQSWTQTPISTYSPAKANTNCFCSGGVHLKGCPHYPGIRIIQQQQLQQSQPTVQQAADTHPHSSQMPTERYRQSWTGTTPTASPQHRKPVAKRDPVAMELDGNPVAAQHYNQYQGKKAAELE